MTSTKVDQESISKHPDHEASDEQPARETQQTNHFYVKLIDYFGTKYWSLEGQQRSDELIYSPRMGPAPEHKPETDLGQAEPLDWSAKDPMMERMCKMVDDRIKMEHVPKEGARIFGTFFVNLSALRYPDKGSP